MDPNHPGRLDPIEIDLPEAGLIRHDSGKPHRDIPHFVQIGPADAILHRPSDGWTES
jgi:hypothetical protein